VVVAGTCVLVEDAAAVVEEVVVGDAVVAKAGDVDIVVAPGTLNVGDKMRSRLSENP
jgi:hypothetical protein